MGFQVKLDTNGTNPKMLGQILQNRLCDYVAMDIKNSPEKYVETCGGVDVLTQVKESAAILMVSNVEYEFRTTVMHPYHEEADFVKIGQWLTGAKQYFIQGFVDSGDLLSQECTALTETQVKALKDTVQVYIPNTQIRGM